MCCLAAQHLGSYVPSQSVKYKELELSYLSKALRLLSENTRTLDQVEPTLAICMLLVHHGVTSFDGPPFHWAIHARFLYACQSLGISIDYQSAIFIVYQIILSIHRPMDNVANLGIRLEWLLACSFPELILDLGLSRKLLYYIGKITEVASMTMYCIGERERQGKMLQSNIAGVVQYTAEKEKRVFDVVINIGRSYQIAALLNVKCRLLG